MAADDTSGSSRKGLRAACIALGVVFALLNAPPLVEAADPSRADVNVVPQDLPLVSGSPAVNIVWTARIQETGGSFRLVGERPGLSPLVLVDVEARGGVHDYRFTDFRAMSFLGFYELRYRSADGAEVTLGKIVVLNDEALPAISPPTVTTQFPAYLREQNTIPEIEAVGLVRPESISVDEGLQCPPVPPPERWT